MSYLYINQFASQVIIPQYIFLLPIPMTVRSKAYICAVGLPGLQVRIPLTA